MKTIIIAFRSIFKKGRNNAIKIVSLGVGLALGLVLIAKVYYEQTYDDFFPDANCIYRLGERYVMNGELGNHPLVSGGVGPGFMAEIPEVEIATRFTPLSFDETTFFTSDKKKHKGYFVLGDSLLFDILQRPIIVGNPKDVLSRPMYAMISKKVAQQLGGAEAAVGQTIVMNNYPDKNITVGGVFEDYPLNSHLVHNIIVSMSSIREFMWDGRENWMGNDRYVTYIRMKSGDTPESIEQSVRSVENRHHDKEALKKAGVELYYTVNPMLEIHKGDPSVRQKSGLLSLLAFALLFTAIMNYILIVISSLVGRSKEMAVNKCYGASGETIYGKMLAETFADMVVALLIATLLIFLFRGTVEELLGSAPDILINWRSGLLLAAVCLVVLLVSGLIPGYMFAKIPVAAAFRNYRESKRFWKLGLLFLQITAACFLVTLLIIIARQYNHMLKDNPGYEYQNLAYVSLPGASTEERQRIVDEVSRLPEVAEVSTSSQLAFWRFSGNNVSIPNDDRELFNIADGELVGKNFFSIMEIPVIEGNIFQEMTESDEVMVNRNFAEKVAQLEGWTDGVVGKQVNITGQSRNTYTICGVYENYRIGIIGGEDSRPSALFYSNNPAKTILIKYHKLTPEVNQHVAGIIEGLLPDKDISVHSYASEMVSMYSDSRHFRDSVLIGGIVTLIITLAGLIAYTKDEINRRRKEVAIRKINGATIVNILRMFMGDINRIALPAIIIGGGISAYVATRWQAQFSEKTSLSPLLFIICALAVLTVVLTAVVINCYKAANENPSLNIKSE